MSRFSRYSTMLFLLMLSFAGIGSSVPRELPSALLAPESKQHAATEFSAKEYSDVYGLQQQYHFAVSAITSLPAPESEFQSNTFWGRIHCLELEMQRYAMQLLAQAGKVCPNLSVKVLLFPFHYFW